MTIVSIEFAQARGGGLLHVTRDAVHGNAAFAEPMGREGVSPFTTRLRMDQARMYARSANSREKRRTELMLAGKTPRPQGVVGTCPRIVPA